MGLKLNVTLPSGVVIENAYARIDSLVGRKTGMDIIVHYYVSQESANEVPCAHSTVHHFVPSVEDAPNYHKQGYEHLKQLEEFAGAEDC